MRSKAELYQLLEKCIGLAEDTGKLDANGDDHDELLQFIIPLLPDEWEPDSHWDNHPEYPVVDWQHEIANGDTRQSYKDWVNNQLEEVSCDTVVPQRVEDMLARLEREFGGNYTMETEANWPWWNKGMSKVVGYQNRISVIFRGDEIASFSFSDPINAELFIRAYIAQENCDED